MTEVQIGERLVLYPGKLKWSLFVVIGFLFAATGIFLPLKNGGILATIVPLFFGLMSLMGLVNLFGKGSSLTLDSDGFEEMVFWRKKGLTRWKQCSNFGVAKFKHNNWVVFNQVQDQGKIIGKMNRVLAGGSSSLADTYGMKAENLAELMNSYRQNAIETGRG